MTSIQHHTGYSLLSTNPKVKIFFQSVRPAKHRSYFIIVHLPPPLMEQLNAVHLLANTISIRTERDTSKVVSEQHQVLPSFTNITASHLKYQVLKPNYDNYEPVSHALSRHCITGAIDFIHDRNDLLEGLFSHSAMIFIADTFSAWLETIC
jgi:hypothetical protein